MALKSKIKLEYLVNCSPTVLYDRLSSASGLAEWFADDVRVEGKRFTFIWDGSEMDAELAQLKDSKYVRFNTGENAETYFEFRIYKDELTGQVSLLVTDFAEEGEENETIELWNSQIADLKRVLGSVY